jgi:methylmalonyl-CoA/ethylmalonyl-CoA epimerase
MEIAKKLSLFPDAEFHHLGLAVSSIDNDLDKTYDPLQKVTVAFVDINGVKVELIKPETADSPARNFVGKGFYHICYEVKNIRESIEQAQKNGLKCIANPVPAKAFNEREIAWLFSPKYGLIELLEK